MEKLIVIAAFAVFLFFAIIMVRISVRVGRKKKFYKALATRYGGNVVSRLFRPRLWFRYGSTMGYLKSARSRAHKERTILILTWPDKKLRFDLATKDQPLRPHRYSQPMDAQEQGFTRELSIHTNRPEEMKRLLSHGVRWKIEQLVDQLNVHSVSVNLSVGKLKIVKPGEIKNYQQLDDLVRMGLELHDQLLLTKSEGIDFVDEAQAKILGDVKCPICSEEVMEEMVICLRCKTPHCKDCWQYNGHCATFACNETRYYHAGGTPVS